MMRALSKALHVIAVTADGVRQRMACVGVHALVTAMLAAMLTAMLAAVPPLHAQRPSLEVGLSYGSIAFVGNGSYFAGLSSNLQVWSRGPLSLSGEASASLRLPDGFGAACLDSAVSVCDGRRIGDVVRFGLTSRVGKRDGSGVYALAVAGWWSALQYGDLTRGTTVLESNRGDRLSGLTLGLGAGVSLPFGNRRTGIEARWNWLAADRRTGDWIQLGLTRRW